MKGAHPLCKKQDCTAKIERASKHATCPSVMPSLRAVPHERRGTFLSSKVITQVPSSDTATPSPSFGGSKTKVTTDP